MVKKLKKEIIKNQWYKLENVNFWVQSENLCVTAQDNDNEEKDNINEKESNEEKEADEQ